MELVPYLIRMNELLYTLLTMAVGCGSMKRAFNNNSFMHLERKMRAYQQFVDTAEIISKLRDRTQSPVERLNHITLGAGKWGLKVV